MGTLDAVRDEPGKRSERLARIARIGTAREDQAPQRFAAGPLSVEFQGGALRYLRYGGQELVRAISFLVRDENWGTYTAAISGLETDTTDERFTLRFQARCGAHGDDLLMDATIAGYADGRLDFEVTAQVQRGFSTNRTGFVVLHPLEVSGLPVAVEHVDGHVVQDHFPERINPLQPFMEIRALTTQHAPGLSAQVRMEGDTFEMEDQRNWSDASFKTYVRPLALPWPYALEAGATLRQAVRVQVIATRQEDGASRPHAADATVQLTAEAATSPHAVPMAQLGIGIRAENLAGSLAQADALKSLAPAFFVAHLDTRHDDIAAALQGFARLSDAANVPYVLEIVLPNDPAPAAVAKQLAHVATHLRKPPQSIQLSSAADLKAVLPGSPWPESPSFETMLDAARSQFLGIAVGAGSFAYFTELNRKRPDAALLDYLSFTTCPIVHAADDRSVMETLTTLPYIARSAQALYPALPFQVGPCSIAARDNPYGSATAPNRDDDEADRICLTDNDPRQRGLFGAAWNLAYFAQFANHGAQRIALSELTGPRGVLGCDGATPLFTLLQSLALPQPVQRVDAVVTPAADGRHPYVLAARHNGELLLWAANPSASALDIRADLPAQGARLRRWEAGALPTATAWQTFTGGSIRLQAYETVQLAVGLPRQGSQP